MTSVKVKHPTVRINVRRVCCIAFEQLGRACDGTPCPLCKTPMTAYPDPDLLVPWYRCRCGFTGDIVHVFAIQRDTTREEAFERLAENKTWLEEFLAKDRLRERVAAWVSQCLARPLTDYAPDDWPGVRTRFLNQAGVVRSPLAIECFQGRVFATLVGQAPDDVRKVLFRCKGSSCKMMLMPLETAPGRIVGVAGVRETGFEKTVLYSREITPDLVWSGAVCGLSQAQGPLVITDSLSAYLTGLLSPFQTGRKSPPLVYTPGLCHDVAKKHTGSRVMSFVAPDLLPVVTGEYSPTVVVSREMLSQPDWYDNLTEAARPEVPEDDRVSAVFHYDKLLYQIKDGRLYRSGGALACKNAFRVWTIAIYGKRRYLEVSEIGGDKEWVKETVFSRWVRQRALNPTRRTKSALLTGAFMLGRPKVIVCKARLGWDEGCGGFGLPGALIKAGVYLKQPWRKKYREREVPPSTKVREQLSGRVGGVWSLAKVWIESRRNKFDYAAAKKFQDRRPRRALLASFLCWATAGHEDRLSRAGFDTWVSTICGVNPKKGS